MEEQLISFETAKLAKEKGFNEDTELFFNSFYPKGTYNINGLTNYDEATGKRDNFTSLPTQSLLQKWLREVHNLHIIIAYAKSTNKYDVLYSSDGGSFDSSHDTYEEALEKGLQEGLKLIK